MSQANTNPYPLLFTSPNTKDIAIDLDEMRRIWIATSTTSGYTLHIDVLRAALIAIYMAGKADGAIEASNGGGA